VKKSCFRVVSKSQKLLCSRLKKMRKRLRLTQEAFAETCGISYKYYQAIENGLQNDMRLSTLERLSVVLFTGLFP
jgi:transcriptional regulator with XRE-family HTH domain